MREMIVPENGSRLTEIALLRCGWISDICWSPDGSILAIASGNTVRLHINGIGAQPDVVLSAAQSPVKAIAFSPAGRWLAAAGADLTLFVWDAKDFTAPPLKLTGHTDALNTLTFSLDGVWLAAGGADETIYVWDLRQGEVIARLRGHSYEITSLIFVQGQQLVSGSRDGSVRLWEVNATAEEEFMGTHEDWIRALAVSSDGQWIASACKDGTVHLRTTKDTILKAILQAHEKGVDSVCFNPNSRLLATGGRDFKIRLWDVAQLLQQFNIDAAEALLTISIHTKPVMALAFNPSGTMLVSGSGDNTVRLWSIS